MLWKYGYLDDLFERIGNKDVVDVKFGEVKVLLKKYAALDGETKLSVETILRFGNFQVTFGTLDTGSVMDVLHKGLEDDWDEDDNAQGSEDDDKGLEDYEQQIYGLV